MKKLSQKERMEVVTKGFLFDCFDERGYATKEYVKEMFEYYQKDMKQHITALMEYNAHYFQAIIETLSGRFERNEEKLDDLEGRVRHLEWRPGL